MHRRHIGATSPLRCGVSRSPIKLALRKVQQALQLTKRARLQTQADVLQRQGDDTARTHRHRTHVRTGNRHGIAVSVAMGALGRPWFTLLMTHCTLQPSGLARQATAIVYRGNSWRQAGSKHRCKYQCKPSVIRIVLIYKLFERPVEWKRTASWRFRCSSDCYELVMISHGPDAAMESVCRPWQSNHLT